MHTLHRLIHTNTQILRYTNHPLNTNTVNTKAHTHRDIEEKTQKPTYSHKDTIHFHMRQPINTNARIHRLIYRPQNQVGTRMHMKAQIYTDMHTEKQTNAQERSHSTSRGAHM